MPSAYYRTEDPIENFKIRVGVREISRARNYADEGKKVEPFAHDSILSWQQKLYSPSDVADYILNKDSKYGSVTQFETRRHFATLEKKGQVISELLDAEVMMYTYVDKDHFNAATNPPVVDAEEYESFLGAAAATGVNYDQHSTSERQKRLAQKLFRDKPHKSMHICFATDINKAALLQKPVWGLPDTARHFQEHILCTITLYQDGLLEVSPALSAIAEEALNADAPSEASDMHRGGVALSAFMDDRTAETAIKKGFRLSTTRLRSQKGAEYEYLVHNTHDIFIPHKIEEILRAQAVEDAIKASQSRSTNWKQDPPPYGKHKTVTYYAEIVSGLDFEARRLLVNYRVKVPKGWQLRTGNLSDGVANKDGTTAEDVNDRLENKTGVVRSLTVAAAAVSNGSSSSSAGPLRGTTHTAINRDSPLSVSSRLSILRPRYRGASLSPTLSNDLGTRLVAGASLFILSIVAVVLGVDHPFWIIPCLTIVFCLGYGPPGGGVQVALLKRKNTTLGNIAGTSEPNGMNRSSKRKSHAYKERVLVGDGLVGESVAVFNHLLSLSFDVADDEDAAVNFEAQAPVIQLQVYSEGWFGRQKLEGYGSLTLSTQTSGSGEAVVRTWKPVGGVNAKMHEFFLGSSVRLRDQDFADHSRPTNKSNSVGALNRFGFLSETSGSLRLRTQVMVTDPRIVTSALEAREKTIQAENNDSQLKRTVADILQTFKSASRGTAPPTPSAAGAAAGFTPKSNNKPSVMSIMAALGSATGSSAAPKAGNKVEDILARARAKTAAAKAAKSLSASSQQSRADEKSLTTTNVPGIAAYDPHIEKKVMKQPTASTAAGGDGVATPRTTLATSGSVNSAGGNAETASDAPVSSRAKRQPSTSRETTPRLAPAEGKEDKDVLGTPRNEPTANDTESAPLLSARKTPRTSPPNSTITPAAESKGTDESNRPELTEAVRVNMGRPSARRAAPHRYDNGGEDEEEEEELVVIRRKEDSRVSSAAGSRRGSASAEDEQPLLESLTAATRKK